MKIKYKRNHSRRRTSWDNLDDLTPLQELIKKRYIEDYNVRHKSIVISSEVSFLNSLDVDSCKLCSSKHIQKYGHTKAGIQRYFCNECKHSFTSITNTIFDNRKIYITEWIEFCLDIFRYERLSVISKTNKNATTTTKYWLKKLFIILENYQDNIILKGDNVYIDETFFTVVESQKILKNGKQLRGLSRNQYCIGIGYDGKNTITIVEGVGKTSQPKTLSTFKNHIEQGSHIIHDKEKSHRILIEQLCLTDEVHDASKCKKMSDKDNPLNPINKQCLYLQKFLKSHPGFNRDDLQDYLNLFCFIVNPPNNKLEKVEILLSSDLNGARTLKYREFYSSKSI
jgi:transposase-like protein